MPDLSDSQILAFHFLHEDPESAKKTAKRYRAPDRRVRTLKRTILAAGNSFTVWVVLVYERVGTLAAA